jgi:hypothetical protein
LRSGESRDRQPLIRTKGNLAGQPPDACSKIAVLPADKNDKGVTTRCEKLTLAFLNFILVAGVFDWLKSFGRQVLNSTQPTP